MYSKRFNYPTQFAILMGLMGFCMILMAISLPWLGSKLMHVPSAEVIREMNLPANTRVSQLLNTFASGLSFFLPTFLLALFISKTPFFEMGFQRKINGRQLFLVLLIALVSLLLNGALAELNELIPLPKQWLLKVKAMEDSYTKSMLAMANMKNLTDYLIGLVVLAFFPALFEEILFRGGFQQILVGWFNHKWIGIILCSILFSLIHFSFFGFLPRFALGIVLGWLFYESKQIGLSIFMHFINNAVVVTQIYWITLKGESVEKAMNEKFPIWLGLIAIGILVYLAKRFSKETKQFHLNTHTDV